MVKIPTFVEITCELLPPEEGRPCSPRSPGCSFRRGVSHHPRYYSNKAKNNKYKKKGGKGTNILRCPDPECSSNLDAFQLEYDKSVFLCL
jgi:hypothetical protein